MVQFLGHPVAGDNEPEVLYRFTIESVRPCQSSATWPNFFVAAGARS